MQAPICNVITSVLFLSIMYLGLIRRYEILVVRLDFWYLQIFGVSQLQFFPQAALNWGFWSWPTAKRVEVGKETLFLNGVLVDVARRTKELI